MLSLGDVIVVHLPAHQPTGHEQEGYCPAIVVGLPERLGPPRFPLLVVVPLTTYRRQAWVRAAPRLYPVLETGSGGLSQASVVLLEEPCARKRFLAQG